MRSRTDAPFNLLRSVRPFQASTWSTSSVVMGSLGASIRRRARRRADGDLDVLLSRLLTVLWGALVVAIAFVYPHLGTIIEGGAKVAGVLLSVIIAVVVLGLLTRRGNAVGTLIGIGVGLPVNLYLIFFTRLSFMWYLSGMFSVVLFGYGASLLLPDGRRLRVAGLWWRPRETGLAPEQTVNGLEKAWFPAWLAFTGFVLGCLVFGIVGTLLTSPVRAFEEATTMLLGLLTHGAVGAVAGAAALPLAWMAWSVPALQRRSSR